MRKISDDKINDIIETLGRADFAINTLERAGQNRILFTDLKVTLQKLQIELKDRYLVKQINKDEQ